MATPLEHFEKAKFKYDVAFHLLKVTFPLVNDPRLLIGVIGNLSESLEALIDTLIEHERTNEPSSRNSLDFAGKFNLFRNKIMPKYHLSLEIIGLITQVRRIIDFHTKSSIEFQRGGKMVLCQADYREMELISSKDVEHFREQTRQVLQITGEILNRKT